VPFFVRLEYGQLGEEPPCCKSRDEKLPGVNAYGTLLTGMVHFHYSSSVRLAGTCRSVHRSEAFVENHRQYLRAS
jgi:hypothetical protein